MNERQQRKGTTTVITQCASHHTGCDDNKRLWRGKSTQYQVIWELSLQVICDRGTIHIINFFLQRNLGNRSKARDDLILVYCWEYTDIWLTDRAKSAASPLMLKIPFSTFRQKINFLAEEFLKKAGGPSTLMLNN